MKKILLLFAGIGILALFPGCATTGFVSYGPEYGWYQPHYHWNPPQVYYGPPQVRYYYPRCW